MMDKIYFIFEGNYYDDEKVDIKNDDDDEKYQIV